MKRREIAIKSMLTAAFCVVALGLFAQSSSAADDAVEESNEPARSGEDMKSFDSRKKYSSFSYSDESSYWAVETQKNPKDANAWYNYYASNRYSYYSKTSKDLSSEEQNNLDAIVNNMASAVPSSYEYNYIKYWNGNHDPSNIKYLNEAYRLAPNKVELYDDFIAHYEITGNTSKKKEFCQKWLSSGDIPSAVMDYNYNVLMSLEKNAILITNGESDTYPLWIWQHVKGVRTDVTVLNIDLLGVDAYRTKKLAEKGLTSNSNIKSNKTGFLKYLASANTGKAIYFGLTVDPQTLGALKSNLFVTGVAMKYSPSGFNNLDELQKNWESKFKSEHLEKKGQSSMVRKLNMNYVLPLLMLSNHYRDQGNIVKEKEVQELALKLAREAGKEQVVVQYLKQ